MAHRHLSLPQSSSASRLTAFALGHDPLATKGTGVLEDHRAVVLELRIEHQPRLRLGHQPDQKPPAYFQGLQAQIAPV